MTGTGVQSDPYIPTTLTEFITAVGTAGAYVALDRDIDAAEDPAYTGYLNSAIIFNAVDCDGGGYVVRGITVQADHFMACTSFHLPRLRNVDFLDCCHKGGGATIHYSAANEWFVLRTVRFAFKRDYVQGASNTIFERVDTGEVSADVTFTGGPWAVSHIIINSGLNTLTMRVSGLYSQGEMSAISNSYLFPVARTALIFDGCRFGSATIASGSSRTSTYAAFRNCSFDGSLSCGASGSGCVVATDDDSVSVNLSSGWSRATIDQMKDKDWLTSVGFLP